MGSHLSTGALAAAPVARPNCAPLEQVETTWLEKTRQSLAANASPAVASSALDQTALPSWLPVPLPSVSVAEGRYAHPGGATRAAEQSRGKRERSGVAEALAMPTELGRLSEKTSSALRA